VGTPAAEHRSIDAEVRRVVSEIMGQAALRGIGLRALSRQTGVAASTLHGWAAGAGAPCVLPLLTVSHQLGYRLEWVPIGRSRPATSSQTPQADWRTNRADIGRLILSSGSTIPPTFNAQVLGAQLHWWRTQEARIPLWEAPGCSHGTWFALEHPTDRKPWPLLRSLTIAGETAGLGLAVRPVASRWPLMAWDRPGAPKYRTP
jgi:hypothetical protein